MRPFLNLFYPEHIAGPENKNLGFGVGNCSFADFFKNFGKGKLYDIKKFVLIRIGSGFGKIFRKEKMDNFVAETGGGKHRAEIGPVFRGDSAFFKKFALCAFNRFFARIEFSCGSFKKRHIDRIAELFDKEGVFFFVNGNYCRRAFVADNFAESFFAFSKGNFVFYNF